MNQIQPPTAANDEAAIRDLFERTNASWGDADAYAAHFSDAADYIAFDGSRAKGRTAIAAMHRPLFVGILKGSRLTGNITALRFLSPDIALIHSSGGVLRGRQKHLARSALSVQTVVAIKREGRWQFVAFQNTRYRPFDQTVLGKILSLVFKQNQ